MKKILDRWSRIFLQSVKKLVFDGLAEVEEIPKTNKSNASAYNGTLAFDLCGKSKHLAKQAFSGAVAPYTTSVLAMLGHLLLQEKAWGILCFDGLGVL